MCKRILTKKLCGHFEDREEKKSNFRVDFVKKIAWDNDCTVCIQKNVCEIEWTVDIF